MSIISRKKRAILLLVNITLFICFILVFKECSTDTGVECLSEDKYIKVKEMLVPGLGMELVSDSSHNIIRWQSQTSNSFPNLAERTAIFHDPCNLVLISDRYSLLEDSIGVMTLITRYDILNTEQFLDYGEFEFSAKLSYYENSSSNIVIKHPFIDELEKIQIKNVLDSLGYGNLGVPKIRVTE